ncbi:MAG: helix-turn-helix transcriptional regulator [Limisphaerales bacterium]
MIVEEHFCLRLMRIKSAEQWSYQKEGLVFLIFKAGTGRYVADDVTIQTAPGDVLILTEGTKGKLSVFQSEEVVFNNFSLCLEHLFPLFASHEIALLEDVISGLKKSKFLPAATPLATQVKRLINDVSPEFNLDHRSQLLRVAAAILTQEFQNAHQRRAGFARTADRIVQVFENLSTVELLNLSIAELAVKFGCSRRHLSRLSQQCLGRSIAALKMEMRLMKAAACLRNPQAKIINVAEQCGFNHLGLFNTCFKKRFGASPGKWRNMTADKSSNLNGDENVPIPSNEPGSARILLGISNDVGRQTHAFPIIASTPSTASRAKNGKSVDRNLAFGKKHHKIRESGHNRGSLHLRAGGKTAK